MPHVLPSPLLKTLVNHYFTVVCVSCRVARIIEILGNWQPVGEPDKIEVVRIGIQLMKRKPITEEEMEAITGH